MTETSVSVLGSLKLASFVHIYQNTVGSKEQAHLSVAP